MIVVYTFALYLSTEYSKIIQIKRKKCTNQNERFRQTAHIKSAYEKIPTCKFDEKLKKCTDIGSPI